MLKQDMKLNTKADLLRLLSPIIIKSIIGEDISDRQDQDKFFRKLQQFKLKYRNFTLLAIAY